MPLPWNHPAIGDLSLPKGKMSAASGRPRRFRSGSNCMRNGRVTDNTRPPDFETPMPAWSHPHLPYDPLTSTLPDTQTSEPRTTLNVNRTDSRARKYKKSGNKYAGQRSYRRCRLFDVIRPKLTKEKPMHSKHYSVPISFCVVAVGLALGPHILVTDCSAATTNTFASRGDIKNLPAPLKQRLIDLAARPRSYLPLTVLSEAPSPSQLFGYYLLDTSGFEPNIFTSIIPGINDGTAPTAANCANRGRPTIGSIRLVLEPKPGLPTDPNDPGAFIDIFTDISGLFLTNNETGWYEGWVRNDLAITHVADPRPDGHAAFGTMTSADAAAIASGGNNLTG